MECRRAALRPRPGAPPSSPRAPCRASCRVCRLVEALVENTPWRSSSPWRAQHLDAHGRRPRNQDRATAPPWIVFSTLPRPAVSPCGPKPGPRVATGELSSSSGFRGLGTLSCRHKSPLEKTKFRQDQARKNRPVARQGARRNGRRTCSIAQGGEMPPSTCKECVPFRICGCCVVAPRADPK